MMNSENEKKEEIRQWIRSQGVIEPRVERLVEYFYGDKYSYNKATDEQKKWAYEKGFCSERIERYGLTEENWQNYMSDVEYHMPSSYKNRRFSRWYDDKASTWFILNPFKQFLPQHYFFVDEGRVRQLYDQQGTLHNNADGILSVLREKKKIAAKPGRGGHGEGFMKLEYVDDKYYINNEQMDEAAMREKMQNLNGYILTDYIKPSKELSKICGDAYSVLRMICTYDDEDGAQITACAARFGLEKNKEAIDYSGCFWCGVNLDTGKIFKSMIITGDYEFTEMPCCNIHPDTGAEIEGFEIPNWKLITDKIREIGNYVNVTPWLTFDVVPTDDGFRILEINSHGMVRAMQPFFPLFENKYMKKLFGR